jgi:hypothetical protein
MENKLLDSFLSVYFYSLEENLNNKENQLEKIKFQSEESNTDEYLKKYFQSYLLNNNNISDSNIESIVFEKEQFTIKLEEIKKFKIQSVYLPNQLTEEQRKYIFKDKKSIYTNPDLYLEISDGRNLYFKSLELKSTKNNFIPGSSVQQVSPYEWVIFVKRGGEKVLVSTGYYINSITEKLPFPDRSPRPQIGFNTMSDWNKKYRKSKDRTLTIKNTSQINENKIKLLDDWQDYLASEWMEIIKESALNKNEKWFNNALRKFAVKFLEYTNDLEINEREKLLEQLNSLIK